jgi:O-antigen ligase
MELAGFMTKDHFKSIEYEKYLSIFFLVIIFIFSFTRFLEPSTHKLSQGILGLGFLYLLIKNPGNIRKDPMFIIFYCIVLTQIATWLSMKFYHPEYTYVVPKIDRLGKLFTFLPIAWWLKDNKKYINTVLILAAMGFIISLFTHSVFIDQINMALNGERIDFGIRNSQHPSMVFGIIFLFSFFYLVYGKIKENFLWVTLSIIFLLISIAGLIATQTRQSFLSLLIALIILLVFSLVISIKKRKLNLKEKIAISGTVVFLVFIAIFSIGQQNRNDGEGIMTVANSLTEPVENISFTNIEEFAQYYIKRQTNTSSGTRIQLWLGSLPWIAKKPFLGWGSGGQTIAIKQSKILPKSIMAYGHLHNFFIGTLLSYGFIGLFFLSSLYGWLLISSYKIKDTIKNGNKWFLLTTFFISYWVVINNLEAFNTFWTGVFVHNTVCGCIYTKYLHNKEKIGRRTNDGDQRSEV